jgi:hypothetical protein
LGAILNIGVVSFATHHGNALDADQIRALLGSIGNVLGGGADPNLRGALDSALRATFWGMLAFALMSAVLAVMVPVRELDTLSSERHHHTAPATAAESASLDA